MNNIRTIPTLIIGSLLSFNAMATPNASEAVQLNQLKYGNTLIATGPISTSLVETVKLKPDTVTFSVTAITEGDSTSEAATKNNNQMKAFNDYLTALGLEKKQLTTIEFKNYSGSKLEPLERTKAKNRHQTALTINIMIQGGLFYDVVSILEQNNINNLKKDKDKAFYTFHIVEEANDISSPKQRAKEKYNKLINQFKKIGITDVSIVNYSNIEIPPEKNKVAVYYVRNTLKIRLQDFKLISKIMEKAQSLDMNVNDDLTYSVSDEEKQKQLNNAETRILAKLSEKAKRLLGGNYTLGAPVFLDISSSEDSPYPVYKAARNMVMAEMAPTSDASLDIQTPSHYEIQITIRGSFDVLKKAQQPN